MLKRFILPRLRNPKNLLTCSKVLSVDFFVQNCKSISIDHKEKKCKLLIIGGGSGGCSVAAKFTSKLGKNSVVIIEPSEIHYYQPLFTLIGAGLKTFKESYKLMADVLPKNAEWIKDSVLKIEAQENYVTTQNGLRINYEYLVVAAGLKCDFTRIPGLAECISVPGSGVCSNYSPNYVEKTYKELQCFQEGNLIFTFPNTPVKCAGAPQKICYLAEHHIRKNGKRAKAQFHYHTSLSKIFGVKKYAEALMKVCKSRDIEVTLNSNLVEIDPEKKIAYFQNLKDLESPRTAVCYSFLHVTPPMGPPDFLRSSPMVCDKMGYLDVDKSSLRHKFFHNIFGIGDCTNLPTSKTAAAVAAQSGVLYENLLLTMSDPDQPPVSSYDGYSSCPLLTGNGKCILAEFDYQLQPLETFPFDQSKESRLTYFVKKEVIPFIYWQLMLKGYWSGPATIRKLLRMHFKDKKCFDTSISA